MSKNSSRRSSDNSDCSGSDGRHVNEGIETPKSSNSVFNFVKKLSVRASKKHNTHKNSTTSRDIDHKDDTDSSNSQQNITPKLSKTDSILKDVNALVGRFDGYLKLAEENKATNTDKLLIFFQSANSVIGNLGGEYFRDNLTDDKIHKLVSAFNANWEHIRSSVDSDEQKEKAVFALAKTTATLKGFALQPVITAAESKLKAEHLKFFNAATKEVLLVLQGESIIKSDYPRTVIDETMKILEESEQKFSTEEFNEFRQIVRQGNTSYKFKNGEFIIRDNNPFNLSQEDREKIFQQVEQTADIFIQKLNPATRNISSDDSHQEENLATLSDDHKAELSVMKMVPVEQHDELMPTPFSLNPHLLLRIAITTEVKETLIEQKVKMPLRQYSFIIKSLELNLVKLDTQYLKDDEESITKNLVITIVELFTQQEITRKPFSSKTANEVLVKKISEFPTKLQLTENKMNLDGRKDTGSIDKAIDEQVLTPNAGNEEISKTLDPILELKDNPEATKIGEVNNSITGPTSTSIAIDVNSQLNTGFGRQQLKLVDPSIIFTEWESLHSSSNFSNIEETWQLVELIGVM